MAHELFHAILADYVNNKWDLPLLDRLTSEIVGLMLNEGIAHYIADKHTITKYYHSDSTWYIREKAAFQKLAENSKILFDPESDLEERKEMALKGTYWDKYICIPAMFMAFHIEELRGIRVLKKCVREGPIYFIRVYNEMQRAHKQLPELPEELTYLIRPGHS